MPVIPFSELFTANDKLSSAADGLAKMTPGMVLTTGQAASGKVTTLLALAGRMAADQRCNVVLLVDQPYELDPFRPTPAGWLEITVEPNKAAWHRALQSESSHHALLVVASLSRVNATFAIAAARTHWVFAALDTPLLGLDASYALREMGVEHETFADNVRCVWSQFLVDTLCPNCATVAQVSLEELEFLFPTGPPEHAISAEVGCAECDGRGTNGRVAISDVTLVTDAARPLVKKSILEGGSVALAPDLHVTAHEQARDLMAQRVLGISTYHNAIRRNPLLRAQNALDLEKVYSVKLSGMFDKFVSPEVKRRLMSRKKLAEVARGEARDVTCLFCDIRGFTSRAEFRDPVDLLDELNRYFAGVVDAVLASDGTIDKFIGDAVMVVFGAPLDQPDHAHRALDCALAIRESIRVFNISNSSSDPIAVGMGISSGRSVAGCIGTEQRMEYTVLGDVVNVAARLETRASAGQILVSEATSRSANGKFRFASVGRLTLRGKAEPVVTLELLGRS